MFSHRVSSRRTPSWSTCLTGGVSRIVTSSVVGVNCSVDAPFRPPLERVESNVKEMSPANAGNWVFSADSTRLSGILMRTAFRSSASICVKTER